MTLARKYALVYLLFGSLWILLSDFLVFYDSDNANASYLNWELFKGLLFVVLTSLLVYYLLLKSTKRISSDKKRIEMREEILSRILENSNNQFGLFDEDERLLFSTHEHFNPEKPQTSSHFFSSFNLSDRQVSSLKALLKECNKASEEAQRDIFLDEGDICLCFVFIPIKDQSEIMVIVENQTVQKRREKDQRIHHKLMELLFHSKEIGIWDWDIRQNIYHNNDNMQHIVGAKTMDEVPKNKEWLERIHLSDKEHVLSAYNSHLEGETESAEASYRFRTLQDNWKWVVEYSMVTERDENGEPWHMIGVLIDFDRFKKAEETMVQQSKLIDQVAFANSHKIRGPLARIKGLILLIEELRILQKNPLDSEFQDILDKIKVSSEELDGALNQTADILNRPET